MFVLGPGAGSSPEPGARSSAEHVTAREGQHHATDLLSWRGVCAEQGLWSWSSHCAAAATSSPAHDGCEEPEKRGESGKETEMGALLRQSQ